MSDGSGSRLRSDLRNSCRDGAAYSAMVAAGESYLPAFALFIGICDVQAGLLASLPILFGSFLQCNPLNSRRRIASFRRFFVFAGGLQVVTLAAVSLLAFTGSYRLLGANLGWALLLVIATFYWAGALACASVWNTWIEYLVPRSLRHRFLARRTLIAQGTLLSSLLAAGVLLRLGESVGQTGVVFGLLFLLAAAARGYSLSAVMRQSDDPQWHAGGVPELPVAELTQESKARRQPVQVAHAASPMTLLIYLVCVQVSVYVAAPYFAAYMLRVLQMDYVEFTVLIALGFAGKMLILPLAGRFGKRFGTTSLMIVGGIGMIPMGVLWVVSPSFWYLASIQLLSGIVWGCYELGNMLLILERIPTAQRTRMLSRYHVFNALAMVVGSLIGGAMLWQLGSSASAYLSVFAASSLLRLLTLPLLKAGIGAKLPTAIREVVILQRQQSIRPSGLNIATPIVLEELDIAPVPAAPIPVVLSLPTIITVSSSETTAV